MSAAEAANEKAWRTHGTLPVAGHLRPPHSGDPDDWILVFSRSNAGKFGLDFIAPEDAAALIVEGEA